MPILKNERCVTLKCINRLGTDSERAETYGGESSTRISVRGAYIDVQICSGSDKRRRLAGTEDAGDRKRYHPKRLGRRSV